AGDAYRRHRRVIAPHQVPPRRADLGQAAAIFVEVDDVPGHPDDMLRPGTVLGEDGQGVEQDLAELAGEVGRDDPLRLVPTDHAGGEDGAARRGDSVRIAFRARPAGGA